MSYPLHKNAGGAAARTVQTETGFWGLDLSEGASDHPFSHASDTENLLWQEEALKVRGGYEQVASLGGRINGIFAYKDTLVVHAGTALFQLREGEEPLDLEAELADAPSHGVVQRRAFHRRRCMSPFSGQWIHSVMEGEYLFIHDGNRFVFFDGDFVHPVADPVWGGDLFEYYQENGVVDFYATVPFTVVAKRPDGGGDADPRGENRFSQFRCESFYIKKDEEFKSFRLNCLLSDYNPGMPPEVQLRDTEGIWHAFPSMDITHVAERENQLVQIKTPTIKGGVSFRCNTLHNIVEFGTGDYVFVDDGMDNLRITYGVLKDPPDALDHATAFGLYGADGADDVLFLGGAGEDAFSAPNDFFCFYATATEQLGSAKTPVTGYCRLSDGRLAVLKDDLNGSAVFFRDHRQVELGMTQSGEPYRVDAYPSKAGAGVEGCLSPFSVGVAGNEPCFLGKSGLYSVRSVSDELTNLNETVRRSIPIDSLLTTFDPKDARGVCWKTYYLLAFGETLFITDGRRDAAGQLRFLKWRLAHGVTAFGQKDGNLYFGDGEGHLFLFGEGATDGGIPIQAFWQTAEAEEKSGRRMILRGLWAKVTPGYGSTLGVQVLRDRTPMPKKEVPLHRLDFGGVDFGNFTFEGKGGACWALLESGPARGERLGIHADLSQGGDLKLRGFRMIYDKGGRT